MQKLQSEAFLWLLDATFKLSCGDHAWLHLIKRKFEFLHQKLLINLLVCHHEYNGKSQGFHKKNLMGTVTLKKNLSVLAQF